METFLPIPGHLGYEVSDYGTVRSLDRIISRRSRWGTASSVTLHGQVLTLDCLTGYAHVKLGRGKSCKVHALVLLAFVGPYPKGMPCINHKDGNRLNNFIENLEYCTYSHNQTHAYHEGLTPAPNAGKLNEVRVLAISQKIERGEKHGEIALEFGVSRGMVTHIAHGRSWGWLTGR